jgi:hypothetical protein
MSKSVTGAGGIKIHLDLLPHQCPNCHRSITPNPLFGYVNQYKLEVLFSCPDLNCSSAFIGYYFYSSSIQKGEFLNQTSFGTLSKRTFSNEIISISEFFEKIYNEAYAAEQQGYLEICGVGFRKAVEFLIKDYAISKYPEEKENIEKKMLAAVIKDFVSDERIKNVAARAVWLGNDETHYVRKWEGKNLQDMKKLIDLTIHWIEMEELTASFNDEMPG